MTLTRPQLQSVSPDKVTAEPSTAHPWHCPLDHPLPSETSSGFTSSTRANLSSWSWQTTHLCVNGLSEERDECSRNDSESSGGKKGRKKKGGKRKRGSREDSSPTIKDFKGSYFVWRAPSYPSLDLLLSPPPTSTLITQCQLTPSATGQLIVLGYLLLQPIYCKWDIVAN